MLIKEDMSYINEMDKELISRDYAELDIHSIHFNRQFTEEQMVENRKASEILSREDWNKRCDDSWREFSKKLLPIIEHLNKIFDTHQYTEEKSSMEHFRSDYDFFYYSNKGWNKKDYFDYFQLSPNNKRTTERKKQDVENLLSELNNLSIDDEISIRIQYTANYMEDKIKNDAIKYIEQIEDTFIKYMGVIGKIKVIKKSGEDTLYGFFKKGAKNRYYNLSYKSILPLTW